MVVKLTAAETEGFVSVVNSLIQAYCEKYPDEYDFDSAGIGYSTEGSIFTANGDDLADTLEWVNSEIIPDLVINECNRSVR
jgi:hypothetical protein